MQRRGIKFGSEIYFYFFLQGEDVSAVPDAVESPIDTDSTEPTEVTFLNCFPQYKETGEYLYEGSSHFWLRACKNIKVMTIILINQRFYLTATGGS